MLEQELKTLRKEINNCYPFTYEINNENQKNFIDTCFLSSKDGSAIEKAYFNIVHNMQVLISFYEYNILNIGFSYDKLKPSEYNNPYFGYAGRKSIKFDNQSFNSEDSENYYTDNRREYLKYLTIHLKEHNAYSEETTLLKIFNTIFTEGFDPVLRAEIIREKILPLFQEKVNTLKKTVHRSRKWNNNYTISHTTKRWEELKKKKKKKKNN